MKKKKNVENINNVETFRGDFKPKKPLSTPYAHDGMFILTKIKWTNKYIPAILFYPTLDRETIIHDIIQLQILKDRQMIKLLLYRIVKISQYFQLNCYR